MNIIEVNAMYGTSCRHTRWLQRAIKLAKTPSVNRKNASCDPMNPEQVCTCVILPPRTESTEVAPLVEAISTPRDSCIDHAAMVAASAVGR